MLAIKPNLHGSIISATTIRQTKPSFIHPLITQTTVLSDFRHFHANHPQSYKQKSHKASRSCPPQPASGSHMFLTSVLEPGVYRIYDSTYLDSTYAVAGLSYGCKSLFTALLWRFLLGNSGLVHTGEDSFIAT